MNASDDSKQPRYLKSQENNLNYSHSSKIKLVADNNTKNLVACEKFTKAGFIKKFGKILTSNRKLKTNMRHCEHFILNPFAILFA